jgi:HAD superfamily hydrolase (TIGR01490 family)
MAIAFFDLDKTLLPFNSAFAWVRFQVRHRRLSLAEAFSQSTWILRYHFGFVGVESAVRQTVTSLRGVLESDLSSQVNDFFQTCVRGRYRVGAREAIVSHQQAGDRVVLLTGASIYLARAVAAELQLDGFLANRFVVAADGSLTGELLEPLCYNHGKAVFAGAYASEHGVTLADCSYYADSYADLPTLAAVGRPIVINPDLRLRRAARVRGWPIIDWGNATRG